MRKRLGQAALALSFLAVALSEGGIPLADASAEATITARNLAKAASSTPTVLKVYNWDDYILPDMDADTAEANGYDHEAIKGINTRFEEYMAKQGVNVQVDYEIFDTNETMLNQLMTGKIDYDLICPSDYMIQRMMADDLLIPFDNEDEYPGSTPNYDEYASPYLISKLASIKAKDVYAAKEAAPDIDADDVEAETNTVTRYMRGYMWGTLGLLYNADFQKFQDRGITADQLEEDVQSWDILWNKEYKGTADVKDSVRDTYAVLILKAYESEATSLREKYEAGDLSADDYNTQLTEIFNRCDDETLSLVGDSLSSLRDNIYGYEVDSGKDDIQRGDTIGIDLAWSGDAVYAMNGADDAGNYTLRYSLPSEGANIWFDGWVMTKYALQHGVTELAQDYINFLDDPYPESDEYDMGPAVANMDYIGYTPFIAGPTVLDYVKSSYDMRSDEDGNLPEDDAKPEGKEGVDYIVKDLSYFFDGTVADNTDTNIYYLPEDKGRQLDTMYPDESQLPYLMVMADFGDQNDAVALMWEAGKALEFPTWGYYIVLGVLALAILWIFVVRFRHREVNKLRKERHAALAAANLAKNTMTLTKTGIYPILSPNEKRVTTPLQAKCIADALETQDGKSLRRDAKALLEGSYTVSIKYGAQTKEDRENIAKILKKLAKTTRLR